MFATRLVLAIVLVIASPMFRPIEAAQPTTRLAHVSGEGTVKVIPDLVVIAITITSVDDDLLRVRAHSDDQARAVLSRAKKHGVAEDHFEVGRLELSLDYNEQLRRQIYQVERDITIRLHQLAKLDGLLSDLLDEPSSKIVGISFGATKAREHQLEALRRAVADAQEKASLLARMNALKLGKPADVRVASEGQSPFVISVIPVVGAAEGGTEGDAGASSLPAEQRRPARGRPTGSVPVRLAAFQTSPKQSPKGAQEAAQTRPFGIGLIEFTAAVSIDFELVAE